ncbi:MAG TPA: hypothetical protein VK859_01510, partial [bacterium]|nr:hypothetical protein [bacterium]
MLYYPKEKRALSFFFVFFLLTSFFSAAHVTAANNFVITGPGAGLYQVNQSFLSFSVTAFNGSTPDTLYNDVVTVGLYSTVNPPLTQSDPGVTIISGGATFTGATPLTFTGGSLSFQMKFEAGTDSEQVFLQDSGAIPVTTGDTYPGTFNNVAGTAITVQGYSTSYFLQDANLDNTPATYPPNFDNLIPLSGAVTALANFGSDAGDFVPLASGSPDTFSGIPPSASAYAVTAVSAAYAAGGQIVFGKAWFEAASNTSSAPVSYAVIIDYDGTLSDYNHPRPNQDTVYVFGTTSASSGAFGLVNTGGPIAQSAAFQPFMSNGQVIMRIWATNPSNPVTVRYETFGGGLSGINKLSQVSVPYSSNNVLPVKGTASPLVFLDGAPATLVYTLKNQFSSSVSQVVFQFPPNNPATGTPWNFTSASGPAGSSPSITSNPTVGGAPGTITVGFTTPLGSNQTAAISLIGTAASLDGS